MRCYLHHSLEARKAKKAIKESAQSHKTHEMQSHNLNPEFFDFKTLALNYYTLCLVFLRTCEYAKESQIGEMGEGAIDYPSSHSRESSQEMCLRSFKALTLPCIPASVPTDVGWDGTGRHACEPLLFLERVEDKWLRII